MGGKGISGPMGAVIIVVVVLVVLVGGYFYLNKPQHLGPGAQKMMDARTQAATGAASYPGH